MIRVFDFTDGSQYSAEHYKYFKRSNSLIVLTGWETYDRRNVTCEFEQSPGGILKIGVYPIKEDKVEG